MLKLRSDAVWAPRAYAYRWLLEEIGARLRNERPELAERLWHAGHHLRPLDLHDLAPDDLMPFWDTAVQLLKRLCDDPPSELDAVEQAMLVEALEVLSALLRADDRLRSSSQP